MNEKDPGFLGSPVCGPCCIPCSNKTLERFSPRPRPRGKGSIKRKRKCVHEADAMHLRRVVCGHGTGRRQAAPLPQGRITAEGPSPEDKPAKVKCAGFSLLPWSPSPGDPQQGAHSGVLSSPRNGSSPSGI